jgi:RNA polymerase II subunit A small phosphatase-like protein
MCRRLTHAAFPGAQDLLCLGRPLADSIIVDNSPHSYVFQPENALPIGTFIDDPNDREARA